MARKSTIKQAGSFGLVGILNTALDFVLLNLCMSLLHLPLIPANLISTTAAQSVSFVLNRSVVFKGRSSGKGRLSTVVRFVTVTAIGLYVVQSLVLALFGHVFTLPGELVYSGLQACGVDRLQPDVVVYNTAKLIATIFSAAWNFVLYKKLVFTKQ